MIRNKAGYFAGGMLVLAGLTATAAAEEPSSNAFMLEKVGVKGAKLAPASITVITAEDIKAKGARTVAEALNDVAGLSVTASNTKGRQIAQFRGSDAGNTKVVVDGVVLSPVGDGRVDLSTIPAEAIAKIEVIKGAVPVIYGSDAPGGLIYITTKSGVGKASGSVYASRGNWDTETYGASIGGSKDDVSYLFGLKWESTDGYTNHAAASGLHLNGKVSWDLSPRSLLSVYATYSESQRDIANRYTDAGAVAVNVGKGGAIARNSLFTGTYNWEYDPKQESYIGAMYKYKFNEDNNVNFKVYSSKEKSTLNTTVYATKAAGPIDYWDGSVSGFELQHNTKLGGWNAIAWGYAFENRQFDELAYKTTEQTTAKYNYNGHSFYAQDTVNIGKRLSASLGYRYYNIHDQVDIAGAYASSTTVPAVLASAGVDPYHLKGNESSNNLVFNFNYAVVDHLALHGSIGRSFRFPNAKERAGVGGYPYGDTTGNSGAASTYLRPERALNREIGLAFTLNSDFGCDVTLFDKDITDMIKGQGQTYGHCQYENIPRVEMRGFEWETHGRINQYLKAFVNYSYTNAYDTYMGRQVSDIPYRKFSYGLTFEGKHGWGANLAVNYVGAVTSAYTNESGNFAGDGYANAAQLAAAQQKLPGYHLVDLKVNKSFGKTECYVKVNNLRDEDYKLGAYLVGPGRYVEVGASCRF